MSRRLAIVGLALGAISELIVVYLLSQDIFAISVGLMFGAPTATAAATLAGRILSRGLNPRWVTVAIPILTGLSYLAFAAFLAGAWTENMTLELHTCLPEYTPCAPLIDPLPLITVSLGFLSVLIAALLYLFSMIREGSPTAHVGRLALLLLSVLPIVSVLGLLGFVILSSQKMKEIPA